MEYNQYLKNFIFVYSTWNTGSHCSNAPMASDRPITVPSLWIPRYFPYPDLNATFVSLTLIAVKTSSGRGPSPKNQTNNKQIIKQTFFYNNSNVNTIKEQVEQHCASSFCLLIFEVRKYIYQIKLHKLKLIRFILCKKCLQLVF